MKFIAGSPTEKQFPFFPVIPPKKALDRILRAAKNGVDINNVDTAVKLFFVNRLRENGSRWSRLVDRGPRTAVRPLKWRRLY